MEPHDRVSLWRLNDPERRNPFSAALKQALADVAAQAVVLGSDDFLEGNRAFKEKRAPRFGGR